MFTGIIEEIGKVKAIVKDATSYKLTVHCHSILKDISLGDSISVNGVCLTVSHFDLHGFTADVMPETLHKTNLASLLPNHPVNLEPSLTLQRKLGGHIVSGHVDGIGTIINKEKDKNAIWLTIACAPSLLRYIVMKGSIAIDGTSLTIAAVSKSEFKISLIPHTAKHTILGAKHIGNEVNLECDILGKYIEKFLSFQSDEPTSPTKITMEFLKENGYA